ncbi:hypothetical protein ACFXTN_012182 [Malus domestica]
MLTDKSNSAALKLRSSQASRFPKNQESLLHSTFIILPRSSPNGPWINNHPPSRSSPDDPFEELPPIQDQASKALEELPPIQDQAPTALEESVHRSSSVHPEESRKPYSLFVHRSSKIKPRRPLDQQSSTFKIKPRRPLEELPPIQDQAPKALEELPPIQDQAPTALEESVHRSSSVHPEESRKPSSFIVLPRSSPDGPWINNHPSSRSSIDSPLKNCHQFKIKPQKPLKIRSSLFFKIKPKSLLKICSSPLFKIKPQQPLKKRSSSRSSPNGSLKKRSSSRSSPNGSLKIHSNSPSRSIPRPLKNVYP